jgi:hypothetical protein
MGTALAVTQQQPIEATGRGRTRTRSTDRCPRCSGLMVAEWCEDLSDYCAQRCVQCGEVIDAVILKNRRQCGEAMRSNNHENNMEAGFFSVSRWTPQLRMASPAEVDRPLSTPRRDLSAR